MSFGIDVQWTLLDQIEFDSPIVDIFVSHQDYLAVATSTEYDSTLILLGKSPSGAMSIYHSVDISSQVSKVSISPLVFDDTDAKTSTVCVGLLDGSVYFYPFNLVTNRLQTPGNLQGSHAGEIVDIKWSFLGDYVMTSASDKSVLKFGVTAEHGYELGFKIDVSDTLS
ncbi:hypothetical protein GEMRC1_012569 [Eukaryota sp. GEM-RC1]